MTRPWTRILAPVLLCSLIAAPGPVRAGSSVDEAGSLSLRVVASALAWLGVPYRYGGDSRAGVDCSGFVCAVLETAEPGKTYPDRSSAFADFGEAARGDIRPGDILLFGADTKIDHVGIALSDDSFIHAASRGPRTGVIISRLDESSWREDLVAARRIKEGKE